MIGFVRASLFLPIYKKGSFDFCDYMYKKSKSVLNKLLKKTCHPFIKENILKSQLAHCFYNFAQFGSVHIVSSFVVTVALAVKKMLTDSY